MPKRKTCIKHHTQKNSACIRLTGKHIWRALTLVLFLHICCAFRVYGSDPRILVLSHFMLHAPSILLYGTEPNKPGVRMPGYQSLIGIIEFPGQHAKNMVTIIELLVSCGLFIFNSFLDFHCRLDTHAKQNATPIAVGCQQATRQGRSMSFLAGSTEATIYQP